MEKAFFPIYVDLSEKKILVIGAGTIASRRIGTLLGFGPKIKVVAPEISNEVSEYAMDDMVEIVHREFQYGDLENMDIVLVATENQELNEEIGKECKRRGIFVNVASEKTLCDFHFPGIVREDNLVVGINAAGLDHKKVKETRMAIQQALKEKDKKIVLGSRQSKLAVIQTAQVMAYIKAANPEQNVSMLTMKTTGDKILDKTLDKIGGKGLFVKELDKALIEGRSDLSVHSLKDMPMEVPEELPLVAFSHREDPRDALVLPVGTEGIDYSKPVGCSSLRRMIQFKKLYPEVTFKTIRGNVQTRLRKLDEGEYSAIILAAAGLKRLNLEHRISRYFEPDEIIPSAGQGILAVQGRKDEDYSCLDGYNDENSAICAKAERAFVAYLDGGCSSPIAAFGEVEGEELKLRGLYYSEDKKEYNTGIEIGRVEDAEKIGRSLAARLKSEMED